MMFAQCSNQLSKCHFVSFSHFGSVDEEFCCFCGFLGIGAVSNTVSYGL